MNLLNKSDTEKIKTFNSYIYQTVNAQRDERAERWRDQEHYDGKQWTDEEINELVGMGINPLTINRTFPTVNLLLGSQEINKSNILAKGRTQKDSEISSIATEGIHYVLDQNGGQAKISLAFKDQVIPGAGFLKVFKNQDPREEEVKVAYKDWKILGWDPYGSPWISRDTCRYVFEQPYMDLDDLKAPFPSKAKDLDLQFNEFTSKTRNTGENFWDEAQEVEESKETLGASDWLSGSRKRIRPVEIYYTVWQPGVFALFKDGTALELRDDTPYLAMALEQAQQILKVQVKKIRLAFFFGEVLLTDKEHDCDNYPYVPFVSYLDRFNNPYGVPRQIKEQDKENNKRRSVELALLGKKRVSVEEGALGGDMTYQDFYDEANKLDSFLIFKEGKMGAARIEDLATLSGTQSRAASEMKMDIHETSGANAEQLGYRSNAQSGVALEKKQNQSATITATLFANYRKSLAILGERVMERAQKDWRHEKIIRITDRITDKEKWVELNKRVIMPDGKEVILNNISAGKFDIVYSDAPATDTVREQNVLLLMETIKKSPPEFAVHLLITAFELMDLPNKEQIMTKLKPVLGLDPVEEDLSPEQLKEKALEAQEMARQAQEKEMAYDDAMKQVKFAQEQKKLAMMDADIMNKISEAQGKGMKLGIEEQKLLEEKKKNILDTLMGYHKIKQEKKELDHKMLEDKKESALKCLTAAANITPKNQTVVY